jgi:hypothetical protein
MRVHLPVPCHSAMTRAAAKPARAQWRMLATAWLAALTFVLMVTTSASHVYTCAKAVQNCQLCGMVAHAVADMPVAPALVHAVAHALYRIAPAVPAALGRRYAVVLPPCRGPPRASA